MGNCFRVRGFVVNRGSNDLGQFQGTGTLFEVLAQLVYYTRRFNDVIQTVVIEELLDENICVEDAVAMDLSVLAADPSIDLDKEAEELRKKYRRTYLSEYRPPKVKEEFENLVLKRIIIERPEEVSEA